LVGNPNCQGTVWLTVYRTLNYTSFLLEPSSKTEI